MSELAFLSPGLAESGYRSPLARALAAGAQGLRDLSTQGKLEVRGEVGSIDVGEVIRITPSRALVLCDADDTAALAAQLRGRYPFVVDLSAALAGLAVHGDRLLRRLTDLDLDDLPSVGAVAGVQCTVLRDDGDEFRLFFAQEYADHVVAVVLDTLAGLEGAGLR